jgi:ABC-type proline/glycine betaine transport system substrate-binding protein
LALIAALIGRLARIDLGTDTVSMLDDAMISGGRSALAVADDWIAAHRSRFAGWIA